MSSFSYSPKSAEASIYSQVLNLMGDSHVTESHVSTPEELGETEAAAPAYVPEVGDTVTVRSHGEIVSGTVEAIVKETKAYGRGVRYSGRLLAEVTMTETGKLHLYRVERLRKAV